MDSAHLASGETLASAVTSTTVAGECGFHGHSSNCLVMLGARRAKAGEGYMVGILEVRAVGLSHIPPDRPSLHKAGYFPKLYLISFSLRFTFAYRVCRVIIKLKCKKVKLRGKTQLTKGHKEFENRSRDQTQH